MPRRPSGLVVDSDEAEIRTWSVAAGDLLRHDQFDLGECRRLLSASVGYSHSMVTSQPTISYI